MKKRELIVGKMQEWMLLGLDAKLAFSCTQTEKNVLMKSNKDRLLSEKKVYMLERKSIQLPLQKESVTPLYKNIRKKKWNNTKQKVLSVTKAGSGIWTVFSESCSSIQGVPLLDPFQGAERLEPLVRIVQFIEYFLYSIISFTRTLWNQWVLMFLL